MTGTEQGSRPRPRPGDFIEIIYRPRRVFARNENGVVWLPTLVVGLALGFLSWLLVALFPGGFDAFWELATPVILRERPEISASGLAELRELAKRFHIPVMVGYVTTAVAFRGLVIWFLVRILRAAQTLRSAFVVAGFSLIPKVAEAALAVTLFALLRPVSSAHSVAALGGIRAALWPIAEGHPVFEKLLWLDPFALWAFVLVGIGIHATGNLSRSRALLATAVYVLLNHYAPALLLGAGLGLVWYLAETARRMIRRSHPAADR